MSATKPVSFDISDDDYDLVLKIVDRVKEMGMHRRADGVLPPALPRSGGTVMTALPNPIPADEVAAILTEHERDRVRPVAEWHSAPATGTPGVCDQCHDTVATVFIKSATAKCMTNRCDICAMYVTEWLRDNGHGYSVEILGAAKQVIGWRFQDVARCLSHKPSAPDDWACTPIVRGDYDGERCEVCDVALNLTLPMGVLAAEAERGR